MNLHRYLSGNNLKIVGGAQVFQLPEALFGPTDSLFPIMMALEKQIFFCKLSKVDMEISDNDDRATSQFLQELFRVEVHMTFANVQTS